LNLVKLLQKTTPAFLPVRLIAMSASLEVETNVKLAGFNLAFLRAMRLACVPLIA